MERDIQNRSCFFSYKDTAVTEILQLHENQTEMRIKNNNNNKYTYIRRKTNQIFTELREEYSKNKVISPRNFDIQHEKPGFHSKIQCSPYESEVGDPNLNVKDEDEDERKWLPLWFGFG